MKSIAILRTALLLSAVVTVGLIAATARAAEPVAVDVRTLANSCAICHGTDGKPPKNGLERLAGMNKREFIQEMREMRKSPANRHLMGYVAGGFSDAEISAMADYFSKIK